MLLKHSNSLSLLSPHSKVAATANTCSSSLSPSSQIYQRLLSHQVHFRTSTNLLQRNVMALQTVHATMKDTNWNKKES